MGETMARRGGVGGPSPLSEIVSARGGALP
jgi:hypothetical protein